MGGYYQRTAFGERLSDEQGRRNSQASPVPMPLEARAAHIAEEAQGSECWHVVRDRALRHLREVEALASRATERTDAAARREYGDDGGAGCVG